MVGVGGSVRDRRRTHARLVGEHAARHAHAAGIHDRCPHEAARCRRTGEGIAENHADGGWNFGRIENEHHEGSDEIEHGGERHQHLGDLRDAFDAADENEPGERRHDGADSGKRNAKGRIHAGGKRVSLYARTDAERCQEAEDGKEHREPGNA